MRPALKSVDLHGSHKRPALTNLDGLVCFFDDRIFRLDHKTTLPFGGSLYFDTYLDGPDFSLVVVSQSHLLSKKDADGATVVRFGIHH